ncbi:hypothetical protein BJ944DRAFT_204196 [Cunninghamella echinulata]|nr:hypothetical protein BJ944DRAFT_204196 [Cunninghamella echinulata]
MTSSETLPVIIIGGGLAGLSLAQSLKHQGIPYQVYEREESPRDHQGWSMSIHFCLPVLASTINSDHFDTLGQAASVNPTLPHLAEFSLINGQTNEILIKMDPNAIKPDMYRVNRKRFRNWLLQGIDVNWGKQVDHFVINDGGDDGDCGNVQVTFTDGTIVKGSCLVGADGVNSSICRQLLGQQVFDQVTTVNPVYTLIITRWLSKEEYAGIQRISKAILLSFGNLNQKYNGSDEYMGCFVSLNDQDLTSDHPYEVIFALSRFDPDNKLPRYDNDVDRLRLLKEWAKQGLSDDSDLLKLILSSPDDTKVSTLTIRERYPQADILKKNHQGRVTLIGDAAHSLTMYRGEGANHAILDAALLSKSLVRAYKNEISFYEAIEQYQEEMIPRGFKAVSDSHIAAESVHRNPDEMFKGIQSIVDRFKK